MKKYLLLSVLFLMTVSEINAQIFPPEFVCVRNDTLFWEPTANSCGPFEGFLVFGSQNPDGPYNLIANVTDPGQTTFYNPDGPGQTWYYYLESDHDCPGLQAFPSDTLDNLIPEIGPLDFVTVDGDDVDMQWTLSPSPEVFAYIIARNTNMGTQDIDTVFTGNTFTDTTAMPQFQSETYFVVALDRCGNRSLVDNPHETIFLEITDIDPCTRTLSLSWNDYINWSGGVDRYEIFASINGGPSSLAGTVDGSTTSFILENVLDNREYCITVEAIEGGTDFRSRSSEACETIEVVQPLTDFQINNASVNPDGTVDLTWQWNTDAELSMVTLLQQSQGQPVGIVPGYTFPGTLNPEENFTVNNAVANTGPVTFQLDAVDNCGDMYLSNTVTTIFLTAALDIDQSTRLNWTAFMNDSVQVTGYQIFQVRNGLSVFIDEVGPGQLSYGLPFNPTDPAQFSTCFFIVADLEYLDSGGSMVTATATSNIDCIEQTAELFVPNAFVPDGVNRTFKPVLQFGTPANYTMKIWDRWGQLLFETNSIGTGWDGKKDGEVLPQGVYVYSIELTREGGEEIVRNGMLTLLR
jgi:gliding motility-associated-like protein